MTQVNRINSSFYHSKFTTGRLKQMFKNFRTPIETTLSNIDELIDSKKAQQGVDTKKLMKAFALDMIGAFSQRPYINCDFSVQPSKISKCF